MEKITTIEELIQTIEALEIERDNNLVLLKDQFTLSIKRINIDSIFEGSLNKITTKPFITNQLIQSAISFLGGYVSKKIIAGNSSNVFKNILGSIVQFGFSSLVNQKPEFVNYIKRFFLNLISKNKNLK